MIRHLCLAALSVCLVALAACTTPPPVRYAVPAVDVTTRAPMRFAALEVLEVSLPRYAAAEAIVTQSPSGALIEDTAAIWADDPPRAITLELVRHIGAITSGKVASAPWPFRDLAAARLEVRIEELTADPTGALRLAGQYFVASESGAGDRSRSFSLTESWAPEGGLGALAAARARIVAALAEDIVARGLR